MSLKSPDEYALPDEVGLVDPISPYRLKHGDVFSNGMGGRLYVFLGMKSTYTYETPWLLYNSYDVSDGHFLGFGGSSFFNQTLYLMNVADGFLERSAA